MGCLEVISMYVLSSKKINRYPVVQERSRGRNGTAFIVSEEYFLIID
jgi:hypothetical protein